MRNIWKPIYDLLEMRGPLTIGEIFAEFDGLTYNTIVGRVLAMHNANVLRRYAEDGATGQRALMWRYYIARGVEFPITGVTKRMKTATQEGYYL